MYPSVYTLPSVCLIECGIAKSDTAREHRKLKTKSVDLLVFTQTAGHPRPRPGPRPLLAPTATKIRSYGTKLWYEACMGALRLFGRVRQHIDGLKVLEALANAQTGAAKASACVTCATRLLYESMLTLFMN